MEFFGDKIANKLPYIPTANIEAFSSENASISKSTYIPEGSGTFPHYQFLIPIHNIPPIIIENRTHPISEGGIICCNPNQYRKAANTSIRDCLFIAVSIDNNYLQEVSQEVLGSGSLEFSNECFSLSQKLSFTIENFILESKERQSGYELILQSLDLQIAITLLRDGIQNKSHKQPTALSYRDNKCVSKAIEYLEENYNRNISLEELSFEVNYSAYHFSRIFKSHTGISPCEFLSRIKIEKAKSLLIHTQNTITEICFLCGFSNVSHFSQAFKRNVGVPPSIYRKNK